MSDRAIAEQARDALHRHVLAPLVPCCIDHEFGGFLVGLDEAWRPVGRQNKSLEHVTRTTLAFAQLDRALPGKGYDQLVRHGCAFLQQAMWDEAHGGFFARVDRGGRPLWAGLKHPHAVNYAARAFLAAAGCLAPGEGRAWAERALAWLDDVAWDDTHGGYWGVYRRDNTPYPEGARLPTPDGRDIFGITPGFKEINTQGDAIEMLTEFSRARHEFGGSRSADRLGRLVELVVERLIDPGGVIPYLYRRDWRPAADLTRVGYQFQMARHLMHARGAMPGREEPVLKACELVDFCLHSARHPHGGFCMAVGADGRTWPATGPASDLRQWWVQVEAVYTLHLLAHEESIDRERRTRYGEARDEQWRFTRDTFFDDRYGGVREVPLEPMRWWVPLRRASRRRKSHCWKDVSHEVGTFLALIRSPERAGLPADQGRMP